MSRVLYCIAAVSFVVGFFTFTWARGCLHRAKRIIEDAGEELPKGKLEYSRLAAADARLASHYRIAMIGWAISSLVLVGSALAIAFLGQS